MYIPAAQAITHSIPYFQLQNSKRDLADTSAKLETAVKEKARKQQSLQDETQRATSQTNDANAKCQRAEQQLADSESRLEKLQKRLEKLQTQAHCSPTDCHQYMHRACSY